MIRKEAKKPSSQRTAQEEDLLPTPAIERNESGSDGDDDDDDDGTNDGLQAERGAFEENLELLLERKTATRVAALHKLGELCQAHYFGSWLAGRTDTIFSRVLHRIRSGASGDETAAAATLLALLFVQLPDGVLIERAGATRSMLTGLVEDPACDPVARAACLTTLALTTTMAGQEYLESAQVMKVMELFFRSVLPDTVIVAAVDAWSLLLTDLPEEQAVLEGERVASLFVGLLENSATDLTVRVACGEAMALLNEQATVPDEVMTQDFLDALRDLATESNKQKSKKELKEQHAIFRQLSSTLENGAPFAEETIELAGDTITVDSFAACRRLRAYRDLLGSGLPEHARANARVRDEFELGPVAPVAPAAKAAKAARSADKRSRMQEYAGRNKDRASDRKKDRDSKAADAGMFAEH